MRHALAVVAIALVPALAHADPLDDARGRFRPVVVLSESPGEDPGVAQQIAALDAAGSGVSDRDIRVLREEDGKGPLHRKLGVAAKGFSVVLVGKDGSVKKVWTAPVDPKRIFNSIDAMPMRRREMRG